MRGKPWRSARRRRGIAVLAALLWLLGLEVLPNLHLAAHADDHTHAATGTIITVSFGAATHRHDDGRVHADHGDAERPAPKRRAPIDTTLDVAPHPQHAAAGAGHHLLALHAPPPPVTSPVAVPVVASWIVFAPRGLPPAIAPVAPSARGPPTA